MIRAEAARRGLNQTHLREAVGLSRAAAFRRWHGQTPWQVDELATVCEAIGVDILDVLTEAGVVRPASELVPA